MKSKTKISLKKLKKIYEEVRRESEEWKKKSKIAEKKLMTTPFKNITAPLLKEWRDSKKEADHMINERNNSYISLAREIAEEENKIKENKN